jgi:hypothetical protein
MTHFEAIAGLSILDLNHGRRFLCGEESEGGLQKNQSEGEEGNGV